MRIGLAVWDIDLAGALDGPALRTIPVLSQWPAEVDHKTHEKIRRHNLLSFLSYSFSFLSLGLFLFACTPFLILSFFFFLWLHPWHVVLGPGIEPQLQQ